MEPIQEGEGGYAEQMRELGVRGMEEFARRVREMGAGGVGGVDEDDEEVHEEAEAGVEVPFLREEE